ncbi:MAG: hypothetical protein RIF32_10100 [Leptospirales bacterium]|jgi:hypothetical protein
MDTSTIDASAPGREIFADQEKSLLRQLLRAELPPIARIRQLLEMARPDAISDLIQENAGLEFTLDYYFRLLPARLGARIVGDPRFTVRSAVCLFYCQLLRADGQGGARPHQYRIEGYWRQVSHAKLTLILRQLLLMGESRAGVFSILQYMSRDNLVTLLDDQEVDTGALLDLFRDPDADVYTLFVENLDLFDFVCRLASETGDDDFLNDLSNRDFAATMMELRIAETLVEEARSHIQKLQTTGERRELPLSVLVHLLDDIPPNVRRMVLERLEKLGYIPMGLALSFMEQRN